MPSTRYVHRWPFPSQDVCNRTWWCRSRHRNVPEHLYSKLRAFYAHIWLQHAGGVLLGGIHLMCPHCCPTDWCAHRPDGRMAPVAAMSCQCDGAVEPLQAHKLCRLWT